MRKNIDSNNSREREKSVALFQEGDYAISRRNEKWIALFQEGKIDYIITTERKNRLHYFPMEDKIDCIFSTWKMVSIISRKENRLHHFSREGKIDCII